MFRPEGSSPSLVIPNSGRCHCCRGTGNHKSSSQPTKDLGFCNHCRGTGRCGMCSGSGLTPQGQRCGLCG